MVIQAPVLTQTLVVAALTQQILSTTPLVSTTIMVRALAQAQVAAVITTTTAPVRVAAMLALRITAPLITQVTLVHQKFQHSTNSLELMI